MRFLTIAATAITLIAATCATSPSSLPFNLTYDFTAHLNLRPPGKPITIPGGVRVVEAVLSGTVSGPVINATIEPRVALPSVIQNGAIQVPIIELYGTTDDGTPLRIHEEGMGSPSAQMARIVNKMHEKRPIAENLQQLEIGGGNRYAALRNGFILASVDPSKDRESVTVQRYLVGNTVGQA